MRPSNKQRSRNKQGNGGHNNNNNNQRQRMGNVINRVFESAGPDGKVRGTPQQIIDKYQALARDAQVSGDRVAAESFLQHAEHYSRLLGEAQRHQMEQRERDEAGRPQNQGGQGQPAGQNGNGYRPQPQIGFGFGPVDEDEEQAGLIETPEGRAEQPARPAPVAMETVTPSPEPWSPADVVAAVQDAEPPRREGRRSEARKPEAAGTEAPAGEPAAEAAPAPDAEASAEEAPAPRRRSGRRRKTEAAPDAGGEASAAPGETAAAD